MKLIVTSLVLLATTLQCQGGLSLLGGILSNVHERAHEVAEVFLGTINKGLNFNVDDQFQTRPGYGYNYHSQQNEYESYYNHGQGSYGYRPNQNGVQRPVNNNGYNQPTYNGNEMYYNTPSTYPNNNYQSYPNNNNFGYNNQQQPNNPNYVDENGSTENQNQGYTYNQNQGYPNNPNYQNNNGYNNQNNGYDSENNVYNNEKNEYNDNNSGYNNFNSGYNDNSNGYNDQNNLNKPTFEKPVDNGYGTPQSQKYPDQTTTPRPRPTPPATSPITNANGTPQGQKYPDQTSTSRPRLTPPTTTPTAPITNANDEKEDAANSQNPNEDAPLFIPLDQNEFGGDKVDITAPKREADKTQPQKAEEEVFPIDIRFNSD